MTEIGRDLLSAYLDGECSDAERTAVEDRVARDDSWRAELAEVRDARTMLRGLSWREPPPGFVELLLSGTDDAERRARRPRRVAFAGSVLGTAAAVVVGVLLVAGGSDDGVAPAVASLAGIASGSGAVLTPVSAPPDLELAAGKYDVERAAHGGATVHEVRRDGRLVARMYGDPGSPTARMEMYDERGRVVSRAALPATTTSDAGADLDWDPPDPAVAGDRFRLVQRRVHDDGIVELVYGDGVISVSVFEQRGELDWDEVPDGGDAVEFAGSSGRRYTTSDGDVWVFERDGVVYTCVGRLAAPQLEELAIDIAG